MSLILGFDRLIGLHVVTLRTHYSRFRTQILSQIKQDHRILSSAIQDFSKAQPFTYTKNLSNFVELPPNPNCSRFRRRPPSLLCRGKMDQLLNAFSILDVDNDEELEQILNEDTKAKKKKGDVSDPIAENGHQNGTEAVSSDYKLPLVWIDLEMTGLDIETDRILEIACIITDGSLNKSIEGPDIVIHQEKECLDKMGEWCQKHHAASGLTEKVTSSSVTEREAEMQIIDFVKKNVGTSTLLLAGNSVYVDLLYLKKYMPELASLFSHVLVDVSSIAALCIRWYTLEHRKAPKKKKQHRAMDDIKESIAELKYYKYNIFKCSKSKK